MPNTYAQKMIEMMNRTGKPMTTTTTGKTTVTTPKETEGLDLSSIMLMLMMNSMFNPKKPSTTLGTTPAPSGVNPLQNLPPAPATVNPPMDLQALIQLLSSLNPSMGGAR